MKVATAAERRNNRIMVALFVACLACFLWSLNLLLVATAPPPQRWPATEEGP